MQPYVRLCSTLIILSGDTINGFEYVYCKFRVLKITHFEQSDNFYLINLHFEYSLFTLVVNETATGLPVYHFYDYPIIQGKWET